MVFANPQGELDKTVGALGNFGVVLPLPAVLGRDLDLQGLVLLRHLLQGVLHVGDHLAQLLVLLLQHQGGSQCVHFCLGEAVLSFLKQRSKLLVLGSQDVAVGLQGGYIGYHFVVQICQDVPFRTLKFLLSCIYLFHFYFEDLQ